METDNATASNSQASPSAAGLVRISESVVVATPNYLKNQPKYLAPKYMCGLVNQKKLMDGHILVPLKAANHYAHKGGKNTLQRMLYFYGPRGSGKHLYVRSFCGKYNVNLITLDFARFDPLRDLELVYATALEYQPCIVLYDQCEGYFRHNSERRIVGKLLGELQSVRDSHSLIWSIFISEVPPMPEMCHTIVEMLNQYAFCGMLTDRDRLKVLTQAIAAKLHRDIDFPLNETSLLYLANAAEHCTPQQIHNYIGRVFHTKLIALQLSNLATLDPTDESLVPSVDDFKSEHIDIGNGKAARITRPDPCPMNIAPYPEVSQTGAYGFKG